MLMKYILVIRYLLLIVFLTLSIRTFSQNLIPNGDFEGVNICTEFNKPCAPQAWRLTSLSLPYYMYVPGTIKNKCVSFKFYNPEHLYYREYLQVPILCPMKKDEFYTFRMSVRTENKCMLNIGVLFTDSIIFNDRNIVLDIKPSIEINSVTNHKWKELQSTYKARGKEKYLIIGYFGKEKIKTRNEIELIVDDVSLKPENIKFMCNDSAYMKLIIDDRNRHTLNHGKLFQDYPYYNSPDYSK